MVFYIKIKYKAMSNPTEKNENVLSNIQNLQQLEKNMFASLESGNDLTAEQQKSIIDKINQFTTMRLNLYKTIGQLNEQYETATKNTSLTIAEQKEAIDIVENELNQTKKRLQNLESQKINQLRMIEINNYYSDKYLEHIKFIKILIVMIVSMIILALLNKYMLLPTNLYVVVFYIVLLIGLYYLGTVYFSMAMRDNMNYEQFDWGFNPKKAKSASETISVTTNPWEKVQAICVGEACCIESQTYDPVQNKCITHDDRPETFQLLKKQPNKYKIDHYL